MDMTGTQNETTSNNVHLELITSLIKIKKWLFHSRWPSGIKLARRSEFKS